MSSEDDDEVQVMRRGGAGEGNGRNNGDYRQRRSGAGSSGPNRSVLGDADENTLRILVSTDNHLGYNERDPVRGMDSFAAFEEVLYLGKRFHCDMILLAGDLFHENRPSRRTLHLTMEIVRRYCMGPNPVQIQILSDQSKNFRNSVTNVVNYQDEYYSVDLPIFSIHGNHDDPSRESGGELLAALDLLSITNLVNYFGRQDTVDKVEVSPVLIQKGTTRVAMYGMGSMRDERLNRMWAQKKVRFLRPEEDDQNKQRDGEYDDQDDERNNGDEETFFNLFALHQNRDLGRGAKCCVREEMIPEWMDVVVWGHEHESLIEFVESVMGTFRISQPGSSVATSLVSGEATRKKVGVLDIRGRGFRLHPVPLTQVRGFVTSELSLREHKADLDPEDHKIDSKITDILNEEVRLQVLNAREQVKETLEVAKAAGNDAGDEDSALKYKLHKPDEVLVRIRVEHSGFTTLNNQRFGARFVGDVANPTDILLFHRQKQAKPSNGPAKKRAALNTPIVPEELERTNMEDLVLEHLEAPDRKLQLLDKEKLSEALEEYVDKNNLATIADTTTQMLRMAQKKCIERAGNDETVEKASQIREIFEHEADLAQSSSKASKRRSKSSEVVEDHVADESIDIGKENNLDESMMDGSTKLSRGKSGNKNNTQRKAGRRQELSVDSEDEEELCARTKQPSRAKTTKRSAASSKRQEQDDTYDDIDVLENPKATQRSRTVKATSRAATRPKRSATKHPATYKFDDGESDDDDDVDDSDAYGKDDVEEEDDDLEIDEEEDEPPTKKKRGKRASPASKKTTLSGRARSTAYSQASKSSAGRGRNRSTFDDSDDEDGNGQSASMDLDDDWGAAPTQGQY